MSKEFKIMIIVFVIVTLVCGITYFSLGDGKDEEINEFQSEIPEGLIIKDEQNKIFNGNLSVNFKVENKKAKNPYIEEILVIMLNDKNKEIAEVTIPVLTTIKKGTEIELTTQDTDVINEKVKKTVYKFKMK